MRVNAKLNKWRGTKVELISEILTLCEREGKSGPREVSVLVQLYTSLIVTKEMY